MTTTITFAIPTRESNLARPKRDIADDWSRPQCSASAEKSQFEPYQE
ncbi:hypothetical protein [Pleurocapsa sp. FMAR1]|nr:hypothetical protein [Pleurocapsa sp. FMAR1]